MKTLMITGIGGDIGQSVARIVREVRPAWTIVGVDVHERHAGTLVSDAYRTVPFAFDAGYFAHMERIVDAHRVDICLPTSEAEMGVLAAMGVDRIGRAALLGISRAAIGIGMDKLSTIRFLVEAGIPAPWTMAADPDALPEAYPCIYKPRRAAGSKGVVICRDKLEAEHLARQPAAAVFQEYLEPADREVTCAVFRDRHGRTAVLPMLRQLAGGMTGWAQVIDAPEAVDQCIRLAAALDLHGPINVQMRLTADGPRIFEVNPRISSTVHMRHLMGFEDLRWLLDDADGLDVEFSPIPPGTTAVRMQCAALLNSPGVN